MEQLLCHLWGDYILQGDWEANNKAKSKWIALFHGFTYSLPFLLLTQSPIALLIIWQTHSVIDHYKLAAKLTQIRNWNWTTANGFPVDRPVWLTTWVIILIDNTLHLTINYLALRYAG